MDVTEIECENERVWKLERIATHLAEILVCIKSVFLLGRKCGDIYGIRKYRIPNEASYFYQRSLCFSNETKPENIHWML